MFKFIIRKSQNKIANRIQDAGAQLRDQELYDLSDILTNQNIHSRSWRKIDKELNARLNELKDYINKGYKNTAGNYEPWLRIFVDARGEKKAFRADADKRKLFKENNELYMKTDEINKLLEKKKKITAKLNRLPYDDPQTVILETDIKRCAKRYKEKREEIRAITIDRYVKASYRDVAEDIETYKILNDNQILPDDFEDLKYELDFYKENVEKNANKNIEIIDGGNEYSKRDIRDINETGGEIIKECEDTSGKIQIKTIKEKKFRSIAEIEEDI